MCWLFVYTTVIIVGNCKHECYIALIYIRHDMAYPLDVMTSQFPAAISYLCFLITDAPIHNKPLTFVPMEYETCILCRGIHVTSCLFLLGRIERNPNCTRMLPHTHTHTQSCHTNALRLPSTTSSGFVPDGSSRHVSCVH